MINKRLNEAKERLISLKNSFPDEWPQKRHGFIVETAERAGLSYAAVSILAEEIEGKREREKRNRRPAKRAFCKDCAFYKSCLAKGRDTSSPCQRWIHRTHFRNKTLSFIKKERERIGLIHRPIREALEK